MAKHAKTQRIIAEAWAALADHHPMTVRQAYYRLVSRQVIENNRSAYQAVSNALVDARKAGVVPWTWIEDRLRLPREVSMWSSLAEFLEDVIKAYRRDVWATQPGYLECWLEKDALSGIFEKVLEPYGVTLNVGRGYDGWSSLYGAAQRFRGREPVTVLYWGDFDPSGVQMWESLQDRLAELGCYPHFVRCALTADDVERYNLPPDRTKATDTRRAAFVARYGDVAVELDALPPSTLESRIRAEVVSRLDLEAMQAVWDLETEDKARLADLLGGVL